VEQDDCLFEFMLNALRLRDEFNTDVFAARTGLSVALLRERLESPIKKGLVEKTGRASWQVTRLGRRFLNDLQAEFLPESPVE
jgi:oxygen-independent coproporphyrinogen-3 oxidase